MKTKAARALSLALSLLLLFAALCLFSACKGKTKPPDLLKLSPEERAAYLLTLSDEKYEKASSYRLETDIKLGLTVGGETLTVTARELEIASGIGKDSYAVHRESSTTVALPNGVSQSTSVEKSGYRDGIMYLSSNESGSEIRLRSQISLADYLAFEKEEDEAMEDPFGDSLDIERFRSVTSTVESDGSYTVTFTDLLPEALADLQKALSPLLSGLTDGEPPLTNVRSVLAISKELLPVSAELEFFFASESEEQISITATASYSEINTATAPDVSEIYGYLDAGDLRLLYRVERELSHKAELEAAAYRLKLSQSISYHGQSISHSETDLATYGRKNGKLYAEIKANDGSYLYFRSYADEKCHDRVTALDGRTTHSEQTSDMPEQEMLDFLGAQLNRSDFSAALIRSVDFSEAENGVYVFHFAEPDISAYADLLQNEHNKLSSASLTVTLKNGALASATYKLQIVAGTRVRIDETTTVEYLERLPE